MGKEKLQEILRNHKIWLDSCGFSGTKANLSGADLSWADLSWADLSWADLSWANLYGANLFWTNLYGADLSRSKLTYTNLSRANLSGANISHTNIVQLQVGKHSLIYQPETGLTKIGCVEMLLSELLKDKKYVEIGKKYNYDAREIELYGFYLNSLTKIEVVK